MGDLYHVVYAYTWLSMVFLYLTTKYVNKLIAFSLLINYVSDL
jgi:hypothetical protein